MLNCLADNSPIGPQPKVAGIEEGLGQRTATFSTSAEVVAGERVSSRAIESHVCGAPSY